MATTELPIIKLPNMRSQPQRERDRESGPQKWMLMMEERPVEMEEVLVDWK